MGALALYGQTISVKRNKADMKNLNLVPIISVSGLLILSACEKKPDATVVEKPLPESVNLETSRLGTAIDLYIKNPSSEHAAMVEGAFNRLDEEIAELDERVPQSTGASRTEAKAKATNLREYRGEERARFVAAQAQSRINDAKTTTTESGEKAQQAARDTGESVKDAADAVKEGVRNTVDTVKDTLP